MPDSKTDDRHFAKLARAFETDGFRVTQAAYADSGRIGLMAEHRTVQTYGTGLGKTAYYVEGTFYERAYLLGLLAEPVISDMLENFESNVLFDFIGVDFLNRFPSLQNMAVDLVQELSQSAWHAQPPHVHTEAGGLLDGCRKANPHTRVTLARLSALNVGIDVLCALAYTGRFLKLLMPQIEPRHIQLPILCNAFSVFGDAAGGGHLFGRDFMFPTGKVLQNHLAHVIHLPRKSEDDAPGELLPYVSLAAPGMLGSLSVMNINGVAAGLNMSPSANSDPTQIGMNSMLLLRECVMRGASAADAAQVIVDTPRGVSWNYVLSDGSADTACTVEAGDSWPNMDFLGYPPQEILPLLPDNAFLAAHNPAPVLSGAAVRWCNAKFPDEYLSFNTGLWKHYAAKSGARIQLHEDAFSPGGFINRTQAERNCPSSCYFAPLRTGRDIQITSNHFLHPIMRLCAMAPWTAMLLNGYTDDIQWRYDALNGQILDTLAKQGKIDYPTAKALIDFLAPYGKFPEYYQKNPKSPDGKETLIKGCVSLFDLKKRTMESHFGYYCDGWVKTNLPLYVL